MKLSHTCRNTAGYDGDRLVKIVRMLNDTRTLESTLEMKRKEN